MKHSTFISVASAVLSVLLSLPASAANITFDSLAQSWNPGVFVTDGYTFSGVDFVITGANSCAPQCPENGSTYLVDQDYWQVGWSFSKSDGGTFSLHTFDGAEVHMGLPNLWAKNINVIGTLSTGATVSQSFALDFLQDGSGTGVDFQKFTLSNVFTNLLSVTFQGVGSDNNWFSVDNVEVDASNSIPEPSSIALIGLALTALCLRNRRSA